MGGGGGGDVGFIEIWEDVLTFDASGDLLVKSKLPLFSGFAVV